LEDIIGSSKFVEDTNIAAQKVEQLSEQRQEKLNRVKAVEKEKSNLEGAKQEAEALLGKDREIRRKRNILYQINAMKETKVIDSLTEKKTEVQEKLDAEREKENSTVERVHELEKALKEQTKGYNKIHDELKVTKDEFTAFERRDIKIREEIKYNRAQKKKIETKVAAETKKEEDAIRKGQEAEESIPEIEQQIVDLAERREEEDTRLDEIHEEMQGATQKLRAELEQKTQELAPVNQERAVFQANLETAETEVRLLEDSTTRARDRLAAAEDELATLDVKQQSNRDELVACEDELAKAKDRIVKAENEEKALAEKEGSLQQRSRDLLVRFILLLEIPDESSDFTDLSCYFL
jgi:structural maintenance of chromosome 4